MLQLDGLMIAGKRRSGRVGLRRKNLVSLSKEAQKFVDEWNRRTVTKVVVINVMTREEKEEEKKRKEKRKK